MSKTKRLKRALKKIKSQKKVIKNLSKKLKALKRTTPSPSVKKRGPGRPRKQKVTSSKPLTLSTKVVDARLSEKTVEKLNNLGVETRGDAKVINLNEKLDGRAAAAVKRRLKEAVS